MAGAADHLAVALATAPFAPVFPCTVDKRPACPHGFKDATDDPERIARWWSKHPDHLVAIPTEGLVVVDLDESDDLEPGQTWRWWCATAEPHGWDVEDCPLVATPRGGLHVYWSAPEDVEVRNSASKLAPGVDVRGSGGYVIAPGSVLPDGRGYELLGDGPWELPEAPGWLVEACAPPPPVAPKMNGARPTTNGHGGTPYGLAALERELGRLATSANGTRNDRLNRAAHALGQLVAGRELDPEHVASELHVVASRTGLDEREIAATITSGLTAGAQQPRRCPR